MDTNVSTPQAVATVIAVEGQAFARDPAGQMRPLKAGDTLLEGDTIVTMPGGQVQLAFLDGHMLTILPNESFKFSAETAPTSSPNVAEAALQAGEAERIIQALERGEDIDELLEATAAGLEGGGNNFGNDFVRLLRIVEGVSPLSYQFDSNTASVDLPEFGSGGQPRETDEAPAKTGTLTLSAPASVTEGGAIVYSATVDVAPQGSPLVLTLSNGLTITIPVGALSGTSAPVPVRADDALTQGDTPVSVSVVGTSGGDYATLSLGSPATTSVTDDADLTTVSLTADASVAEGGNITYTASLNSPAGTPVTITLSNGATITIAAGSSLGSVSVPAPNDDVHIDAGSVSATIVTASGGNFESLAVNPAAATTAISDTLDVTTVSLSATPSVAEGGSITYTASLNNSAQTPVSVTLSNGAVINIAAGASSGSISVAAPSDDVYLDAGSVNATIASAAGGNFENLVVNPTAATTAITDTANITTISISGSASAAEGGTATYLVSLTNPAQTAVTVNFAYSGTATQGVDFTGVASVTIPAGSSSASFSIPLASDLNLEGAETLVVSISSASGGNFESLAINGAAGSVTTSVTDSTTTATVSLSASASVAEGGVILYTASLTGPALSPMSVTLDNGAVINIATGTSSGSTSVAAPADDLYVDAGNVNASIVSTTGGSFSILTVDPTPATTSVSDTIDNTTVSLTATANMAEGGNITYTASLNNVAQTPVTVMLSNGATISIAAGTASGSISVAAPSDDVYLDAGTVSATIASASGGNFENLAINPAAATTAISDTVDTTTVSLTATSSVAEGGNITYAASLNNVAQSPVTVTLSNGATISIAAGASSGSVSVPAPFDDAYLDAGSISATITSATGGNFEILAINPAPATTSINDTLDATTVSLTADATVAEGGNIVYSASLSHPAGLPVSVVLSNGAVINIAAGASSGTVSVAAPTDDAYVDASSVSATIASAAGGNFESLTINPAAATTSITDSLDTTTLSLTADAAAAEGGNITYTASLNQVAQTPVSVSLSNGATITIAAGASSGSVSVPAPSDDAYLDAGSISASISSATGGNFENLVINPAPAATSITDTVDVTTVSLTADAAVAEGGNIVYTASLNNAAQSPVTVTLSNGATISIATGATSGTVSIAAPADDAYLDAGSVSATITSASGGNFENLAINPAAAVTGVGDTLDTTTVSLTASASVAEGGNIMYTASLNNVAQTPVSVTLSNGATITIAAGASSGTVSFAAPADDVYLDAGTISATIASASGGNFESLVVSPAAATTSISDTLDTTTVSLTASASVAEGGNITYTASLNNVAQTPVSVTLSNGTTITIAAGASSGSVSAPAPSDDAYLDAGSISATIASASGGNFENLSINPVAATTSITDTTDTTTVSLGASASVAEGGNITYTASLNNVAQTPVSVTLSNGAVISIAAGTSTGSISIAAPADDVYADAGSVSATIASASGGNFENLAINPAPAATSITDTIESTTLSLSASASVAEGGNIVYTASLNNVAQTPVSITLSNGATITIAAGASAGTVSVAAPSDDVYLDAGSISASIASATGGNFESLVLNPTAAVTSITDTLDTTTVSLTASASVAEGGNITYTASLNNVAQTPVSLTLSNGATITIAAGASSGTVSVAAPVDDVYLDSGSVSATISSASGGNFENLVVSPAAATTSITDTVDVTTVSLSASASVAEGGNISYTAILNNVAQTPVSITLSNGATISIAAGASSGSVNVPAPTDDTYLDSGSISASISSATGGNFENLVINPAPAATSITDTIDVTSVSLTASASVAEGGSITYTASLNNVAQTPVSLTLSNGATISIAAGASTGSVSVAAPSDDVYVDAGNISATIATASGGNFESLAINPAPATTSVTDTLDTTTVSISGDGSVAEGASASYTVSLTSPAQSAVTVNLSYSGTAANGADFTGVASVTIPVGSSSASFSIATLDDVLAEGVESFSVSIASATGGNFENLAVSGAASSVSTAIVDDDVTSVSLSATPTLTEAGGTIIYTATVNEAPISNLTLSLSNGATITILAGQTTGNTSIAVAPSDDVYLDSGSLSASISSATGGGGMVAIDPTPAVTAINDTLDTTTLSLSATPNVAEGGNITYTASLDNVAQTPVTVTLSNGATISIAAGASSGSVSVAAPADDVYLDASSVSTTISSASGGNFENLAINPAAAVTAISDTIDATTVSLTATPSVAEGGSITYTASLNNVAQTPVSITLSSGATISIAAGASSGSVSVAAPADDAYLDAGSVTATISAATGGNFESLAINPAAAVTSISDTIDVTSVTLTASASVAEGGNILYTASLNNTAQTPVTVTLSNGATISIAAGASSGSVSVAAPADDAYVSAGTVSTTIASAAGGNFESLVVNPAAATTSITDTLDSTTVSLSASASVAEGGNITYTASLDNVAQTPVSVTLSNGAVITIGAGATSGSVSVAAPTDDVYLNAGSISATISSATGGNFENLAINPAAAATSISDTLDVTTVSLTATPSVAEGGNILYTASLNNAAGTPVSITLSNGAVISIAAGASSGSVSVAAPADDVYVDAGSVSATIASAAGGNFESLVVSPAAAITTITDTLDSTTVSLSASASVAEGGNIVYTASLNNVAQTPVSVTLSNGAVISIAAGASTGSVSVAAPSDDVYIDAGSISATIASASGGNFESLAINPAPATTSITDTTDTTTVSLAADAAVGEGGNIVYTASLNNAAQSPVTVTLSNGATITIAAGTSTGSISVVAPADDVYVDAGSVSATIASATGGNFESLAINPAAATTTISDTLDSTTLSLSASASVAEGGNIVYTASLNNVAQTPVSVTLSNGAVISIAAGASSGTVSVAAPTDDVYVDAGSVSATIASAAGGNFENLVVNPAAATTGITDTFDTTTVSLTASASVAEGGNITYTASLNNVAQTPVSVTLSNGAVVTIAAGASSGSVSVAAPSDDVYLDAGSVSATITSASGGNFENLAINPAAATTSITDTTDTTTVSLSADAAVAEGGSMVYTATLDHAAETPVSIVLSNGATIAIAAGSVTGTVSVPAPTDDVYLDASSISATIASATGGNFESLVINPAPAVTSIADTIDVTTVTLTASASVAEGGNITYTASLNNVAQTPVSVTLSNGSVISIAAGASSGTVSVAAPSDDAYVDAGPVSATIASTAGGNFESLVVNPAAATTSITDTLDATTVSLSATASVAEGGNITYTATLNNVAQTPVSVTLSNGAIISIAAGTSTGTVSVAAPGDDVYLDASTISATIASAAGGNFESLVVSPAVATTSITDTLDTTTVSLTASASVAEGGNISYTASLNNVAQAPVTITLSNGATISIAAGASSGSVSVLAPADDAHVDTGNISASISSAAGGNFENLAINPAPAVTSVTDTIDVTTLTLSASASVAEGGSILYTASLNNPASTAVSVTLSNGATISIAAGASSGTVSVAAPSDDVYLDAGSISATITSASGGNFESLAVNPAAATTSITDTLDTTTLDLTASASVVEGGAVTYTASVGQPVTGSPLTVSLSNGLSLTIPVGASSASASLSAPDDVYTGGSSLSVTVTGTSGANYEALAIGNGAVGKPVVTTVTDDADPTTVSLSASGSVAEGGNILYTASLSSAAQAPVSVTLSNGSVITIAAGASSGSVSVPAPSDDVYLDAGSISATITSASGGNFENLAINPASATTSITDTVDVTTIGLTATPNVAEGGNIVYTASLNNAAPSPVTVTLSNGATISIATGASSGTVSVPAPSDDAYIDAGSVSTTIASASGGNFENLTINPAAAVTSISDSTDTTSVSLTASASVAEGGNIMYTASLNNVAQTPVSVTLSNGATITIAAGASSGTVSFAAPADDVYLDAGTISATIASASGGNFESLVVSPAAATTSISDTLDTTTVSLTASASVAEGGNITYTASLNNVAQTPVSVTLSNGATITIAAGSSSGTVSVAAPADDVYLDSGSVSASITSASGGNFESLAINPVAATTSITDTLDSTTISLSADASVPEGGNITYTASLNNVAQTPVSVTLSNGAVISIAAGASTGSISIAAPADDVYVDAGSISATIASASGGNFESLVINPAATTTAINDTLDTTTVSLSADISVAEGGNILYTATLSSAAQAPVSITLSNGAVISIATGSSAGSVSIAAPSDDVYLDAGSINATITSATGGNFENLAINPAVASTTISDTLDVTTLSLTATPSVAEGGNITYTASLNNVAQTPVSVTLSNGTTITIAAGTSSGTVSIAAPSDDVYLDTSNISTTITSATGGNFESLAINPAAAVTSITDTLDATTVSLSASASVAEGGNITYTASLNNVAQTPVSVTLSNGTVISIAAGASAGSVSIAAPTDDVYIDAGSLSATIASASGGDFENLVINPAPAATSITDTIDVTSVSLTASASVAEGGSITYTASLNNVAQTPVSVTLSNGATISIAAGASTGSVSVAAPSDDVYVDAGNISATIATASGGNFESLAINPAPAITSVTDTSDTTTVSISGDGSVAEGASASYTVSLTSPAQSAVTVNLSYSGTAANGADFTGVASVTIPAGASSASFSIATLDDALAEGVESFSVSIASATGGNFENLAVSGSASSVSTSIGDNDTTTLSVSSPSVLENSGYAQFTVSLSNASSQSTTVNLALTNGSATAADFGPGLEVSTDSGATWMAATSATIPANQTSVLVRTPITSDTLDEASETFSLTATQIAGTPVTNAGGAATGTATITDDDATPSLSINNVTVNEGAGTATFTVTLSAASGQTVTVNYGTNNGTALSGAGNDFTAASGTLTFNPGTISQTITVPILNDGVYEGSEAFNVILNDATNATLATASGIGTILDNGTGAGGTDNDMPTLAVSSPSVAETGGYAQFTVSLSNPSTSPVVFTPSLNSGTATLGTDTATAGTLEVSIDNGATWSAVSGNVSIAAGSTSVLLRLAVTDDATVEGAESFILTTTVVGGGTLNASASGTATITDNDAIVVAGTSSDDDDVNENRDALAGNNIVHTGVISNVAPSVTLAIDDSVTSGLTSNGEAIAYSWDSSSRTLTASTASGTVFTVSLNAANDGYAFTQLRGIDHAVLSGENHSLNIPLTLVALDANGNPFTSSVFNVAVSDDAPSVSGSKTITTENDGSYVESGFLGQATLSNDITGVSWNTAALPAMVFDGKPVLYVDNGNGTLTGQLADGTLIFRATINPNIVDANNHPQYSFELLNTLGRLGIEGSESSYTVISGGNISNLDLGFGGYLVDSMTAVDGSDASTTVNTNNNWIGLGGNWFNPGEKLFMAFTDVSGNAGQVRGMDMLVEGQGSAPYTLNWSVTAAIDYSGNTITYSGTVSGVGNADVPFSIPLTGGALYFTNLQISAPAGSGEFRIALSGISANDYFSDIPLALDYTLTDADGDTASGLIDVTLMSGNAAPFIGVSQASATVSEEGLVSGLIDAVGTPVDTTNASVMTGSMAIADPDGTTPTVTLSWPGTPPALTSGGVAVTWTGAGTNTLVGSAGGAEVVRIAMTDNGSYTVTLSKAIDHATANTEDVFAFDVQVSATDGVATTTGTLTVNIEDDSAVVGNLTQAVTVPQQNTNLMVILDVSGSMGDPSGIAGQTRLQAAKAAISQLIDSYDGLGNVAVRVVYFSTTANASGSTWVDATTGKSQINALTANGYTNYDEALGDAITAFANAGKITGAQNVSYFISDGEPTRGAGNTNQLTGATNSTSTDLGIQASEETTWTTFLNNNEVKSYALGIGTGLPANAQALLNPIAYDGTGAGTNTNAAVVTDMSQLSAVLQGTVPPATAGNLLTGNVGFGSGSGADGGYMPALTLDGSTYTYDSGTGAITVSGSGGSGYTYDGTTHELSLSTTKGGIFKVDMDDGSYSYTPSGTMSGTVTETIGFSLTDADGDTSSGILTLNVSREGSTITGTSGANTLTGTTGADTLIGGGGNDTLSGLVGGDTFTWQLADRGTTATPARDTITDFDLSINSDKLDLRDLLQGELHSGTDAGNLANYLHFSFDSSTNTTVLEVKSQGAAMSGPDQIINLSGVDLVTGHSSDQQIIQDLLSKSKLITD